MKVLKVYDKINRNTFHYDANTGNLIIKKFYNDFDYLTIFVNTKLFCSKNDRMAYFSCIYTVNNSIRETLDITGKYIFFTKINQNGLLAHSDRIHIKDKKSIVTIDRIYDNINEFIELENHKGKNTIKFKIRNEILNNFKNKAK